MYPSELKYTKDHEWVKALGDGTALFGITNFAQEALGDVVYVTLPEVGESKKTGEDFGSVESVKTVSECYAPTECEILEVNGELEAHPEYVNEDPYGKGWMVKIKLLGDLNPELMDAEAYEKHVEAEGH